VGVCIGGVDVDISSSKITFRSSCLLTLGKEEVTQCEQFKKSEDKFFFCVLFWALVVLGFLRRGGVGVFLLGFFGCFFGCFF